MIPESFRPINVTDTCAIWNLIGSSTLFRVARQRNMSFVITNTVYYECFTKSKGRPASERHRRLRGRLAKHIQRNDVNQMDLTIDDLQDAINTARQYDADRRLGYGEISCAALARRLRQAVLTDNKRDFRVIAKLVDGLLQTTARLLGWLYLHGHLTDGDVGDVIRQHGDSGGHMSRVYECAHREACQMRLARHGSTSATK